MFTDNLDPWLAQQVGKMIMNEFWEKIKMVSEVIREQKEAAEMKKQLDADLDDMVCQNLKISIKNFFTKRKKSFENYRKSSKIV